MLFIQAFRIAFFLYACLMLSCSGNPEKATYQPHEYEQWINLLTHEYRLKSGEPLSADTFHLLCERVQELEKAHPETYYRIMATAFVLRAGYASIQGEEADIPAYLVKAEHLLEGKTARKDLELLSAVYGHLGSYYNIRKGDLGMARSYEIKSNQIDKLLGNYENLAISFVNLATSESDAGKHRQALSWLDSAAYFIKKVGLNDTTAVNHCGVHFNIGRALLNQGIDLWEGGQFALARTCFQRSLHELEQALSILDQYPGVERRTIRYIICQNIIRVFIEMDDPTRLRDMLRYARALTGMLDGDSERDLSFQSLALGQLAVAQARMDSCAEALATIRRGEAIQNRLQSGAGVYNRLNHSRFLNMKAVALYACAKTEKSAKRLRECMETYSANLGLLETLRREMVSDEGLEQLNKTYTQYATRASLIALSLFRQSGQPVYAHRAFQLAEQGKAVGMRKTFVFEQMGPTLPGDLKHLYEQERYFRQNITGLETRFYQSGSGDAKNRLRDSLTGLRHQYEQFIGRLRQSKNPECQKYYQNSFDETPPTISNVRAGLPDRHTAALEYVFSGRDAAIFVITPDRFEAISVTVTDALHGQIEAFREHLNFDIPPARYVPPALALYHTLLQPVEERALGPGIKQLIVVPDRPLAGVIFENLLTADSPSATFQQMPFLFRRYAVAYTYSLGSQLLANNHAGQTRASPKFDLISFIAFPDAQQQASVNGQWAACSSQPLPELGKAAANIGEKLFPAGQNSVLDRARKKDYFEYAPRALVLHFALHGCFEADRDYRSNYLQFRPEETASDGRLSAGEIWMTPIRARMVVLASCNTAQGELSRSEGLKSIARAFMLAGCPSVVATLALVNDHTTATLTKQFYATLNTGTSIAESLRLAKLSYCETAPAAFSHPKYWANIVLIGDPRPIGRGNR